jgi:hypothetical protein
MSTTKKRKVYMTGGIPIYPGGFSCVFKPQLKCKSKNKNKTRRNSSQFNKRSGISKLLFKEHAKLEMDNIHLFYNALKRIPKSHKYFLLTKSKICSPAKIPKRDLKGFDSMCSNFTNNDVYESNINANIENLRLINMPNAGVSINEWLSNAELTNARIILFNKMMSELITNAIVPMNRVGVIHNDIKEDNILISSSKTNPRPTIIDWGISGISTSHNPIPEIIINRYISVSNPFSSIIFTSDFMISYSGFLKMHNNPSSPSFREELSSFALSQYLKFKDIGHYSHIERFFIAAFTYKEHYMTHSHQHEQYYKSEFESDDFHSKVIEKTYHRYASAYITDVLIHFTDFDTASGDGIPKFQYAKYFTEVYIFNCDIWGVMCCYNIFFSVVKESRIIQHVNTTKYFNFLARLLSIFTNQIMVNGHEKINVKKLTKSITNSFH